MMTDEEINALKLPTKVRLHIQGLNSKITGLQRTFSGATAVVWSGITFPVMLPCAFL